MERSRPMDFQVAEPVGVYVSRIGKKWQLQEAKARFSDVFRKAYSEGPQIISRQGKDAVVVIPLPVFQQLVGQRKEESIVEFFANSPLSGIALDLERDQDTGRDIRF